MEYLVAGLAAGLLTLFDLDRTFYVPAAVSEKRRLYAWWWGFIVANGLLAAASMNLVSDLDTFKHMAPGWRALAVATAYMAVIRAKLTTFKVEGKEVPFGLELLYEGAKDFVYKRINSVAVHARYEETMALAKKESLVDLATQAKLRIEQDALVGQPDRARMKAWVLKVIEDTSASELDKKLALANYILSGQVQE
jgi:hypothetical protein